MRIEMMLNLMHGLLSVTHMQRFDQMSQRVIFA